MKGPALRNNSIVDEKVCNLIKDIKNRIKLSIEYYL